MSSLFLLVTAFGLLGQDTISSDESVKTDIGIREVIQAVSPQNSKKEHSIRGAKYRFVFGFGAGEGLSLMNFHVYEGSLSAFKNKSGIEPCISTSFRLGYAPSEKFFICWNSRANWFRPIVSEPYSESSYFLGGGSGLGVTFFPFKTRKDVFMNFLFGYSNLGKGFKPDVNSFGTEMAFGAGLAIMEHLSLELNFQTGSTDKGYSSGRIKNPAILNLTVNYVLWKNQ